MWKPESVKLGFPRFFSTLIIWLWVGFAFSQTRILHCRDLGTEQGLSQSTVYSIARDEFGFLWIGTYDGLNRFDGSEITIFSRANSDLPDNVVKCLFADGKGQLWIGTGSYGLVKLDISKGLFQRIESVGDVNAGLSKSDPDDIQNIFAIAGSITVQINHELYSYKDSLERIDGDWQEVVVSLGTESGLWLSDETNKLHYHKYSSLAVHLNCVTTQLPINDEITDISQAGDQHCLVSTSEGRLFKVRRDGHVVKEYTEEISSRTGHERLRKVAQDSQGRIWLGLQSQKSLVFDPDTKGFRELSDMNNNANGSNEWVFSFFEDSQNIMWVGTYGSGARGYKTNNDGVAHYDDFLKTGTPNIVTAVLHDDQRRVWIGTHNQGIIVANESMKTMDHYDDSEFLASAFMQHRDGSVWIGSVNQGIKIFNNGSLKEHSHSSGQVDVNSLAISNIVHDGEFVVLATNGAGVYVYDGEQLIRRYNKNSEVLSLTNDKVWEVFVDRSGRYWVGTVSGLNVIDKKKNQVAVFLSDSTKAGSLLHNTVDALFEDSEGDMWIGTSAGLCRLEHDQVEASLLHPEQAVFKNYTVQNGMPNDVMYAIVEDDEGFLWCSTNRGLARLDKRNGTIRVFDKDDGLQSDEFNSGAAIKLGDGRLLFGGINGLNVIKPNVLMGDYSQKPVLLTSGTYATGSKSFQLDEFKLNNLEMKSKDAVGVEIDFAVPDLYRPDRYTFFWQLQGLHTDWISLGNLSKIEITSLNPGDYELRLRSCYESICVDDSFVLPIKVIPAFWQSTWFRTLMVIFAAIILNFIYFGGRKIITALIHWKRSMFVGPYRIIDEIGKGGMATVYRAVDLTSKSHNVVAVKVLDQFTPDETRKKRFLQESTICESLDHPNVIRIFTKGEHAGKVYFAMEYVEGKTLRAVIKQGSVNPLAALLIGMVILRILKYLHNRGIFHRDLKPENIMLTRTKGLWSSCANEGELGAIGRSIRLLDFGLAKVVGFESITRSGVLAGTISYLPPECISGTSNIDSSVDYYALGIILYELVTGVNPYEGSDYMSVVYAIVKQKPKSPRQLDPLIPDEISSFIMQLINKNKQTRLVDYDLIHQALWKLVTDELEQTNVVNHNDSSDFIDKIVS